MRFPMKHLFALLLVVSLPAFAATMQGIAPSGATVVLFDKPCTNKVILDQIKEDYRPLFQAGKVELGDIKRELCWTISGGGVVVVDDAGMSAELPVLLFAPNTSF